MKIAIILDPLDEIKTYKDTTYAMMAEAAARGHELHVLMEDGVMWKRGRVVGESCRLELTGTESTEHPERWYRIDLPREDALADFDAVLMRKDPPFDMEYVTATWLLELAGREGARVFNDPRALRDHSEKLAIAEFPQFTAPTLVTRMEKQIHDFIDAQADVVVKPLDGMGGAQVFRVTDADANRNVIVETLTNHGTRSIMAQRYIPEIRAGDKRILLINGEPVPYSLARIPKAGETRGNLAAGGTGRAQPLSARDREIAETIAPWARTHGIFLAGLDVIGDFLTEINVTSPTCFQEIREQTGCNVAGLFIDALEKACAA